MANTFTKSKKRYSVKKCGLTKTQARKAAADLRKDYPGAAMEKNERSGKYCVGTRGKKAAAKSKTKSKSCATKKRKTTSSKKKKC